MLPWLRKYARRAELTKPLATSQELQDFCQTFEAHAEKSPRVFRRAVKHEYNWYCDPDALSTDDFGSYQMKIENIEALAIHIPYHRLDDFYQVVSDKRKYKEMEIRNRVPAVKLAYERYQMLLKMCGGDYDAGY